MHGELSTAPRARRGTTLRLTRPPRSPAVPPPMASSSGPFGAAEILDAVDTGPSPALRLFVLLAVLGGALGVAAFVLTDRGDTSTARR
jgi:hypothetical protein